jgi:hypothetical protein
MAITGILQPCHPSQGLVNKIPLWQGNERGLANLKAPEKSGAAPLSSLLSIACRRAPMGCQPDSFSAIRFSSSLEPVTLIALFFIATAQIASGQRRQYSAPRLVLCKVWLGP